MIKVLISRGSYMRPDSHLNMGGVMEQGKSKRNKKKKKKKPIVLLVGAKEELKGQFRLESCSSEVRKIDVACPI